MFSEYIPNLFLPWHEAPQSAVDNVITWRRNDQHDSQFRRLNVA